MGYILVGFITNIILARLLGPETFGAVGITLFFIIVSKVIVESGLSGALIRLDEISDRQYSSVLVFNVIISLILILLINLLASSVANFYQTPIIKDLLIISSLILIIDAFRIVQDAKLIKEMNFKKKSLFEFISIFISSIVGVSLALNEYGPWSIIIMNILTVLILVILLWINNPIKIFFNFDFKFFKKIYSFGFNTTISLLLTTFFDSIYQLIIGKYFSIKQNGLFYNAKRLQEIPLNLIESSTISVSYTSLAKVKDDQETFKSLYVNIRKSFSVIIGLICMLIFYYAEIIILFFYGSEWIESVFYIRFLIVSTFFYMQEIFNRMIFKIYNRTDRILQLEILKKSIQLVTIIIGITYLNLNFLLIGLLFTSVISYLVNFIFLKKINPSLVNLDLILLFKLIAIIVSTLYFMFFLESTFNLSKIFLLPLILSNFIFLLNLLKIINYRNDIKTLQQIFSNKSNI